jgi:hypothetical protein
MISALGNDEALAATFHEHAVALHIAVGASGSFEDNAITINRLDLIAMFLVQPLHGTNEQFWPVVSAKRYDPIPVL